MSDVILRSRFQVDVVILQIWPAQTIYHSQKRDAHPLSVLFTAQYWDGKHYFSMRSNNSKNAFDIRLVPVTGMGKPAEIRTQIGCFNVRRHLIYFQTLRARARKRETDKI